MGQRLTWFTPIIDADERHGLTIRFREPETGTVELLRDAASFNFFLSDHPLIPPSTLLFSPWLLSSPEIPPSFPSSLLFDSSYSAIVFQFKFITWENPPLSSPDQVYDLSKSGHATLSSRPISKMASSVFGKKAIGSASELISNESSTSLFKILYPTR